MSGDDDNRHPSVRPSRVDAGWEEVPSVVPEDTVLDPSVDSKELTSPHPSQRFSDLGVPIPRRKTVIGIAPPGAGAPRPVREAPTVASSGPSMQTSPQSSSGLVHRAEPVSSPLPRSAPPPAPSAPPPPPSARYPSAPPPPPSARYPSAPPPPPSQRSAPPPVGTAAEHVNDGQYVVEKDTSTETAPRHYSPAVGEHAAYPPAAPPPDYGAPPPPSRRDEAIASSGLSPARKPYDSLESIHSVSDFVSASSLTTDPSVELESLEATRQRPGQALPEYFPSPALEPERPLPPAVTAPAETSGTRELNEITAPPIHFMGEAAASTATGTTTAASQRGSQMEVSASAPVPLPALLKTRTLLGSSSAPLWGVLLGALVVVAALVMLLSTTVTALIARSGSPAAAPTEVPTAATTADPVPIATVAAPPSVGAESHDKAVVAQIEAKGLGDRSSAETLTLAEAKRAERRAALAKLEQALAGKEPSPEDVKLLREAVEEGDSGFAALRVMAALAGPAGPDLIYESWTKPRSRTPITELAESLAYSKDVRAKASPALKMALDLRAVEECEPALALVQKASEVGDRRSLYPLSRLTRKTGCGDKKRSDCFPCLGKRTEVVEALRAAGRRQTPRY
jgi:hypothetical protein